MKTKLWTVVFVLPSFLLAQPTLDKNQFARIGDGGSYLGVRDDGIRPGPSGMNVVWDFSHGIHYPVANYQLRFLEPKDAPHAHAYPEADLVREESNRTLGVSHAYYQTRQDRRFFLGHESTRNGTTRYEDLSLCPQQELAFGETNVAGVDGYFATVPLRGGPLQGRFQGTTEVTYDGYGTLHLPNGQTYHNVMRVKTTQAYTTSLAVGRPSGQRIKIERYQYFEANQSAHLFEILERSFFNEEQGVFRLAGSVKLVYYRETSLTEPRPTARTATHLTQDASLFQSTLLIYNPSTQEQTLALTARDNQGTALTPADLTIPAGTTWQQAAATVFGPDAASFTAAGCKECTLSMAYRPLGETGAAQIHHNQDLRRLFRFYPGEWDLVSDGQAIVNTSNAAIAITARQIDFEGQLLKEVLLEEALAPGAKHLSLWNDYFENQPNTRIEIQSDGLMSLKALRFAQDPSLLYQNLPLPNGVDATRTRWLPHLTSPGSGFVTEVLIHNRSEETVQIGFQPFDQQGRQQATKIVTLQAGQTRRFTQEALFPKGTSHASLIGSEQCQVSLVYRADSGLASSAVVHETTPNHQTVNLYPSDGPELIDGLALVNSGEDSATIHISQITATGEVLARVALTENLAPNAKLLSLPGAQFTPTTGTHFQIESSQPLAVLSLRLSKDGRYLFSNEPFTP